MHHNQCKLLSNGKNKCLPDMCRPLGRLHEPEQLFQDCSCCTPRRNCICGVHRFMPCSHEGPYSVSVLGDLHLEPAQMQLFHEARQQLTRAMADAGSGARVVQLGDLGGYKNQPGDVCCLHTAAWAIRQHCADATCHRCSGGAAGRNGQCRVRSQGKAKKRPMLHIMKRRAAPAMTGRRDAFACFAGTP